MAEFYAVMCVIEDDDEESGASVVEVFSSEGLAQTHAAKLRQLQQYNTVYSVKPLVVDIALNQEICYHASCTMDLDDYQYNVKDIHPAASALVEQLPNCEIDIDLMNGVVDFVEYGWSPKDAKHRLIALMENFIVLRKSREEERQAAHLSSKQAAAKAYRARFPFLRKPPQPQPTQQSQDDEDDLLPW
jgi:hypothetical protein